jgi:hypothetical protein
MSLNNPVLGEGFVPAYQISPVPFVTSSNVTLGQTKSYEFDFVTKSIFVQNTAASGNVMAISFTANGLKPTNSNFLVLSGGQSLSQDVRASKIFISGSSGTSTFSFFAGLTNIPVKNFLTVTGSNGYTGVG